MVSAAAWDAPRPQCPLRVRALIAILIIFLPGLTSILYAQTTPAPLIAALRPTSGVGAAPDASSVTLLVGRSTVLDVPSPITRVSLTSSDVADAVVTTPQQVLVHGKAVGAISMFVWERAGGIRRYEVVVHRDLSELETQYRLLFPGEQIAAASNGKNVVLSGSVSSKFIMDKASELAAGYVEKKENVVNLLQQGEAGSNQVLLRVRFAEVSRSALTELGASFFTGPGGFHDYVAQVATQQFPTIDYKTLSRVSNQGPESGRPPMWGGGRDEVVATGGEMTFSDMLNLLIFNNRYNVGSLIKMMQSRGLFQSLAEPNLIAANGKEASFLAGGEYPYPIATPSANGVTFAIQFKEFGIRLNFTPTLVGPDLINLKVRPEVSALDFRNAITLEGFRIPALSTRRTETEIELRDGQTFAIAGLLNNNLTNTLRKVPGIGDIPILGYLFKSKALEKNQTELVVMITPQLIRAGSTGASQGLPSVVEPYLGRPDRSLQNPPPYTGSPVYPTRQGGTASNQVMPPVPQGRQGNVTSAPGSPMPQPGTTPATAAAPADAPATATPASRPMTREERQAFERARQEEQRRQRAELAVREAEQRRAAAQARVDAQRTSEDQRRQAAQAKKQQELDREQARQKAESDRRAAEARKRQEEAERKRGQALAEAEARLKAAQAAYQEQLKRSSTQNEQ